MSARRFLRKLVMGFLRLTAVLLVSAACGYIGGRLWPLDLNAPRYPAFPAPRIQGSRLVVPFFARRSRSGSRRLQ